MEVHHHSHSAVSDNHRGRKKWTHYFWEFLMLFLAVTLGFLVENQREHFIEHLRAKQYALSLIDDLKKDTTAFRDLVNNYTRDIIKLNEFRNILSEKSLGELPAGTLYYYCEPAIWSFTITFHDASIQQLKNSGNLRYFPTKLQYEISEYDRKTREVSARQENEIYFSRITREMMTGIFDSEQIIKVHDLKSFEEVEDFKQMNIGLLRQDTMALRKLINEIIYRHFSWQYRLKDIIEPAQTAAFELLKNIKQEYHLK